MSRADEKIDQLYQLPLDEFTPARNALAKELGEGSIKKLDKPNVAAWAVNQLYWRERKLYDDVIKTAGQLRTAHKQVLAGKAADLRAVEVFNKEALRQAKHAIRRMLEQSGNSGAESVMMAIAETLDALPAADRPGRLTRPLRRTGFEALQGVTIAARAKVEPPKIEAKKSTGEKETEKDRRKREADQEELLMAKERLRFAEAAERESEASLERARRTLERAERTRERIEGELEEATVAERGARKELASSESAHAKARAERERLQNRIRG